MKITKIEHVDDFGTRERVCWLEVTDVPKEFEKAAKKIDKKNYNSNCFGVCVGKDEEGWYISQDSLNCELFYIDNDGDKHWMEYTLDAQETDAAIKMCKLYTEEVK